tara:strand:+ start:71 stop:439 length:369 start_codon:yes stop_codon:yes gene_type:complete
MKSYFQGLITGIFFTASLILFMGQTTLDEQLKKQLKELEILENEIEMLGKSMSKTFNDNQSPKNTLNKNQRISIENKFKRLDQKIDFVYRAMDEKIDIIYTLTSDNNGILQDIYTDGIPCNN